MIETRVRELLEELGGGNPFHEPVTLVAATKTRSAEEIARALGAGAFAAGENCVQEFREKAPLLPEARWHFIGRLQTNKVKYLVGKCDLIESADRDELLLSLSERAKTVGCEQKILIEINAGGEESKGGYPLKEGLAALERARNLPHLLPCGFMTVLPASGDEAYLCGLADGMRALFEEARKKDGAVRHLSMGMSGDYRLCVAHGSNMVRLGTTIFGPRAPKV